MSLRICIVLGRSRKPGPGERRFIEAIAEDARFTLAAVTESAPDPARAPALVRWVLDLERFVFPAPDGAPEFVPDPVDLADALKESYDVVVDFSQSDEALTLAGSAQEGLWRLTAFDLAAGLSEARDGAAFTQVQLIRHRPQQAPQPISTATYNTKFLATRNAALIREKSVQMIVQALARLAVTSSADGAVANAPARRPLEARDLPLYLARTARELTIRALNAAGERLSLRPGMFTLRLGEGGPLDFDPATSVELHPPANTFWADPFLFEQDGALYLFYEEYDYKSHLGHLCVGRVEGNRMVPLGTVLKRPYHLSYPFVFRWGDTVLMIPETHAANRVEVWRATKFPTEWELANVAFEGFSAVDTVVFEHGERWWLFTNICRDSFGDHGAELHLFQIDSPMLNEVVPHPLNPVVIDTNVARGAGRVFTADGRLFRTSQENSHGTYGFGLNVMEIIRLDETGYNEQRLRHVLPDFADGIMACHHMDAAAGRFVIDVRRRALGGPNLWRG